MATRRNPCWESGFVRGEGSSDAVVGGRSVGGCEGKKQAPRRSYDSRCSSYLLSQLVPAFTEQQKSRVREIGFGFILQMNPGYRTSRLLCVWLYSNVILSERAIQIDGGRKYHITGQVVKEILGVGGGNRSLFSFPLEEMETVRHKVASLMCIGAVRATATVRRAREILTVLVGLELSEVELAAFTVAIVIFTVGSLLAPRRGGRGIDLEVLQVLCSPTEVGEFDWADYTVHALMESARDVQFQLRNTHPDLVELSGCTLLIEVFYLENISELVFDKAAIGLPKITVYTPQKLNMLLAKDAAGRSRRIRRFMNKRKCEDDAVCEEDGDEQPGKMLKCGEKINDLRTAVREEVCTHFQKLVKHLLMGEPMLQVRIEGGGDTDIVRELTREEFKKQIEMWVEYESGRFDALRGGVGHLFGRKEVLVPGIGSSRSHDAHLGVDAKCSVDENIPDLNVVGGTCALKPVEMEGSCVDVTSKDDPRRCDGIEALSVVRFGSCSGDAQGGERAEYDRTPEQTGGPRTVVDLVTPVDGDDGKVDSDAPKFDETPLGLGQTGGVVEAEENSSCLRAGEARMGIFRDSRRRRTGSFLRPSIISGGNRPCAPVFSLFGSPIGRLDGGSLGRLFSEVDEATKPFGVDMSQVIPDKGRCQWLSMWLTRDKPELSKLNRNWIDMVAPVSAVVSGVNFRCEFGFCKPMSMNTMAAIMAVHKEVDDVLFCKTDGDRWRLFLHPGWAEDSLGSSLENIADRWGDYFTPPFTSFDASKCTMIFAPAFIGGEWMCFAFNLKVQVVHIIHPGYPKYGGGKFPEHLKDAGRKMLKVLLFCLRSKCGGVVDADAVWPVVLYKWEGEKPSRWEYGWAVAVFAAEFDGIRINLEITKEVLGERKARVACQLVDRKGSPVSWDYLVGSQQ
ncbi:hypothetical protein ACP70R_050092 [Stipagrostis hirtigluma subsp. patula]